MSQPLLEIISERRTCRLIRTQEPAIIRANQNHASSGLPSSTEAAPLTGKPKMLSHSETDLEQPSISQSSGSQSALLISCFSRMSRMKSHAMTAIVRKRARDDESPSPNKVAIWGSTRCTDDKFLSCLRLSLGKPNKSGNQLKCAEKTRRVTDIESGYTDVLGHDGTGANDDMIADCNREHGGIRTDRYMITKSCYSPKVRLFGRASGNERIIDEHGAMRNEAFVSDRHEITDE